MNKATCLMIAASARTLAEQATAIAESGEVTQDSVDTLRRTWLNVKNACRGLVKSRKK